MTGIELIAKERNEQIEKHGYSVKSDKYYKKDELINFVLSLLLENKDYFPWWNGAFSRVMEKPRIEQLAIAGALIAAEIDRIKPSDDY